jgi:DTW domain-containing protein YfiP
MAASDLNRNINNQHEAQHADPTNKVIQNSAAHLVSSPERFAESHGMTIQQVQQTIDARKKISLDLHHELLALDNIAFTGSNSNNNATTNATNQQTLSTIGKMKHQLICQSRFIHHRNPFVCKTCWTHQPICMCPLFEQRNKITLPNGVRGIYVWTHHDEWGRTANTGSMLPLGLENTQLLMKGLDSHDEIFHSEVLSSLDHNNAKSADDNVVPVVLWPGKAGDNATVTLPELRQRLNNNDNQQDDGTRKETIVLISIEGTWNNARKMANRLPSQVLRLDIGNEISTFYSNNNQETYFTTSSSSSSRAPLPKPTALSPSILAPLRRQGKGKEGGSTNVSTLEATIIALMGLGMDEEDGRWILSNAKEKVDRIREFTGKVYARS